MENVGDQGKFPEAGSCVVSPVSEWTAHGAGGFRSSCLHVGVVQDWTDALQQALSMVMM